jgi:hypothetical protein
MLQTEINPPFQGIFVAAETLARPIEVRSWRRIAWRTTSAVDPGVAINDALCFCLQPLC